MYQFNNLKRTHIKHKSKFISELYNCVIFIPNENQQEITELIQSENQSLKKAFSLVYKQFFLASDIKFKNTLPYQIKYRFPILNTFNCSEVLKENINSYLGIPSNTGGFFIIEENSSEFIEFNYTDLNILKQFFIDYLNHLNRVYFDDDECLIDSRTDDYDYNIKLDDKTQEKVDIILNQLSDLKSNGELLKVLPIIERYIQESNTSVEKLSRLVIDEDYNILLPDYDIEIKLRPLTKAIYLLFLEYPEGILLSDLEKYKRQIMDIYKEISNRENYDKMLLSIDDIINTQSNAIYVHLSRIKSAFTNVLHPEIAKHYIIYGDKSKPKKISLDTKLLISEKTSARIIVKDLEDLANEMFGK